jgi:hypothetical protein
VSIIQTIELLCIGILKCIRRYGYLSQRVTLLIRRSINLLIFHQSHWQLKSFSIFAMHLP